MELAASHIFDWMVSIVPEIGIMLLAAGQIYLLLSIFRYMGTTIPIPDKWI